MIFQRLKQGSIILAVVVAISKFPEEILCNEDIMQLLSLSTTRIEHMQVWLLVLGLVKGYQYVLILEPVSFRFDFPFSLENR